MKPILELKQIKKSFGDVCVLDNVNLTVKEGEIHALLGENGAGKTTLLNIILGMPEIWHTGGFLGEIWVCGQNTSIKTPKDALKAGIGMVHQEILLIEEMTVYENIFLNNEIDKNAFGVKKGWFFKHMDHKKMKEISKEALFHIGAPISPDARVCTLSLANKQMVEIARETVKKDCKLIVLDEPTALLAQKEVKQLFECLKRLTKKGISILFITHRLEEALLFSDSITVLRNKTSRTFSKNETDIKKLSALILGKELKGATYHNPLKTKQKILCIENFFAIHKNEMCSNIHMDILKGEIFGVSSCLNNGAAALLNGIAGLAHAQGRIVINGRNMPLNSPLLAAKAGIGFVSEDRKQRGVLTESTIEENIALSGMYMKGRFLKKGGFVDWPKLKCFTQEMIEMLDIRCENSRQKVGRLSGGNQQKVCIAKILALSPDILIISEIARGIDTGAQEKIFQGLFALNKKGMTIIISDSDFHILKRLCHRIAILHKGLLKEIISPANDKKELIAGFLEDVKQLKKAEGI